MLRCLFFLGFFCSQLVFSQTIFPYLEIENDQDFDAIEVKSVQTNIALQAVLGSVETEQKFINNSDKKISINYIIPIVANQNLYYLTIEKSDEKIKLESKALLDIRKQAQLSNKKVSVNQDSSQRMSIELTDLLPNQELIVRLKWTKIIPQIKNDYQFYFPIQIAKRTKNFTETKRFSYQSNAYKPKNNQLTINVLGNNLNAIDFLNQKFQSKKNKENHQQYYTDSWFDEALDFRYNYVNDQINSDVLMYQEANCQYILGTIQPPKTIDVEKLKPREYIFLLDTSGSMKGFALEGIKKMMLSVIDELNDKEKFNIYYFNRNTNQLAVSAVFATEENKQKAKEMLTKIEGNGNMKLNQALKKVNQIPVDFRFNRLIVIASDGRIEPNQNIHLDIKSNLKNAQYFVLGIGQQVDRQTLNYIGYTTGIEPLIIENESEIEPKLNAFQDKILTPLLRNIEVKSTSVALNETFPKNFNGFLSNQTLNFITKNCKSAQKPKIEITGKDGDYNYSKEFNLSQSSNDFAEALKFYWVKNKINSLMMEEERCGDYCRKTGRYRKEIEKLGEEYNIATPYNVLIESRNQNQQQISFHYDYDTDGDGVNDLEDQCPNEKGPKEANGCPIDKLDPKQKKDAVNLLANENMKSLKFAFDSDEIRKDDEKILIEIIGLMKKYDQYNFLIEGHTDAAGSDDYNLELSKRRAESVKSYLIDKGISSNRLESIGVGTKNMKYAECKPIDVCVEWKNFENRRVIIKIIN